MSNRANKRLLCSKMCKSLLSAGDRKSTKRGSPNFSIRVCILSVWWQFFSVHLVIGSWRYSLMPKQCVNSTHCTVIWEPVGSSCYAEHVSEGWYSPCSRGKGSWGCRAECGCGGAARQHGADWGGEEPLQNRHNFQPAGTCWKRLMDQDRRVFVSSTPLADVRRAWGVALQQCCSRHLC